MNAAVMSEAVEIVTPRESAREAASRFAKTKLAQGFKGYPPHRWREADGTVRYFVIRLKHPDTGEKWVRPMYLNGAGEYVLEKPPAPETGRILYNLPALLAADPDTPLFIVEGEGKVDALAILGVLATTSGSSSSADKADFSPLHGFHDLRQWPDNDAAGMKYAAAVVEKLQAQGCTVRLVADEVVEALPEKGDVVNWLHEHPDATAADILALPTVEPPDTTGGDLWPEPTPLPDALPPVAPFDAELLPEGLRGWVMDIAERMQCPPDFPAIGAVTALSALVGARAVIAPKQRDDWRVVPNLWGLIVGRPGVMKSPALTEAMKPLKRLETDERKRWQAEHDGWEQDCKLAELQAKENAKQAAMKLRGKDEAAARALLTNVEQPEEPTARRYVVNDSSQEKLADLLTVNPWGLLVYRDELHGLIRSMDKEGQEGARGFYLTGHDGNQGYAVDRIGRGESYVPRVCVAMLGGIQPGKIQRYVREAVTGGAGDDGLLQRFGLAVWPDISGEWRKVDRWPDTEAKQAAWAVFERLNGLDTPEGEPQEWRFSPDAQVIYWEWAEPFEREIHGIELHPALVSHLSKYRKLIPALALLFALVDAPNDDRRVDKADLLRALSWYDYLRTHAERLYAAAVIPETAGAETLLAKIQAGALADSDGKPLEAFTPRQVAVKHWAGLATPADVRNAADVLADYDWLEHEVLQSADSLGRGRPSDSYRLHPALLEGAAS